MPANCISRLLLFVSVCAVWEALAKSLPDQGALGKLAIRGMRHNEEMGVVAFLRLLSTISRSVQRCALILWQPERYLRLITGEAFCRACPGIASSFGGIDSLINICELLWQRGHAGGRELVMSPCCADVRDSDVSAGPSLLFLCSVRPN